jgi:large subunit ribosomal protein L1
MAKHGKRYVDNLAKVDREREYTPSEAIALIKSFQGGKLDETVEVHIRTGLNVRHAEEQLRGTISLPHGLGREMTVAVFAKGDKAREAQEAGADHVGDDDLAKRVEDGFSDFDVAIATPDMMPVVGRLGRVLGPQGKMPNPKVGTVTNDVTKAVSEAKAGKIEYRTDRTAIVHLPIGKASFEASALVENFAALIDEVNRAKPASAKGRYLETVTVTTTMGPGVRVDPTATADTAGEAAAAVA